MARLCSSKSQKLGFTLIENENPFKCTLKLDFPPVLSPEDLYPEMKQGRNFKTNKLNCSQNQTSKGKLRFQCHYEDRKRRAEFRRKKIIQKLKKNYAIDVDGLNEDVTRELIMKAEMIEKEKHQKEKRNVERMVTMLTRLIEEQKYKTRGTRIYVPPWRRPLKNVPKCLDETSEKETETTRDMSAAGEKSNSVAAEWKMKNDGLGDSQIVQQKSLELKPEEFEGEEETAVLPRCADLKRTSQLIPNAKLRKPKPPCLSVERCLESYPRRVVFNNYEKGKVYLQDLRITNIGTETIHCRYLGIVVHTKGEDRFPVGVAVRDNVKLRPGLSCSTKIRLCSQEDTKELQCSVVYETRRQRNPLRHSWFFVSVICVPVRAIVKVTPLKIVFPSLTWCEATGPEGKKLLRKTLKIENSGGKACWCRISNTSLEPYKDSKHLEIEGEAGEAEDEGESINTKSNKSEQNYRKKSFKYSGEFDGEGYLLSSDHPEETARELVDELFNNVFAAFRFSTKYNIDVPPFSTVHTEVRFHPLYKGFHHEMYFVQFEDCYNCVEQAIELVGDIKQMPLRLEPSVIDLKTCIANSGVYAGTFKIYNESKGPYSVILKVPSSMKNHAHVYPRATTILPLNCSDFSVRIYPRVTLSRDAPRYYNDISQVLEFPIFIHPANVGACKRDCVKIYVFALITDYCLELSPSSIDFGMVTTLETVRTELELTNHSLAVQEYGFLNLPKGVRVEPNLGFGTILPKETITLYLLYSPGEDLIECDDGDEGHEFQVVVTSIAKYGGFREKLEPDEESTKYPELFWGEDYAPRFSTFDLKSFTGEQFEDVPPEDSEDFDVCDEESSIEGEELCSKIYEYETKIRQFLQEDTQDTSDHSLLKKMPPQTQGPQNLKGSECESRQENYSQAGEYEGYREVAGICPSKPDLNIVNCRAFIVQPRCRISETVIRLPATSCSSFSLYRFRLECIKQEGNINCPCGFKKVSKCAEKQKYQCTFEFQYCCPQIKLEPESGFIMPGDTLPITIIHRPQFPENQPQQEPKVNRSQKSLMEAKNEKENTQSRTNARSSRLITAKSKLADSASKNTVEDVIKAASHEMGNSDLLDGEKSLAKLISPFYVETKLLCVIKTKPCENQLEKTEVHEMVLLCPAIKPNFVYLGKGQEVNFSQVFVGTRSKMVLQIQNTSLERISPSATLLNPVGSFFCPAGIKMVEVDPEHIWRQPLIYAPVRANGIEKEFFEIYCDSTNIFLTVSGEAVQPECKIIPNFACCQMEAKLGVPEELKLEVENHSSITMNVYLNVDFLKEAPDLEIPVEKEQKPDEEEKVKKEAKKPTQKNETRKKSKNSVSEAFQLWEEVPEAISSTLSDFEDVQEGEEGSEVFTLAGVTENNEIVILPSGKQQIKIQFKPPSNTKDKKYIVKYSFMLERVSTLKEILVIGKIFKGKDIIITGRRLQSISPETLEDTFRWLRQATGNPVTTLRLPLGAT